MAKRYTLAEGVDLYFINQGIDKKKYFVKYLTIAGFVWSDIYTNILNATKAVWLTVKKSDKYNYVDIPEDCERIYSINTEDDCSNPVPLYFNKTFHVEHIPEKQCDCENCGCTGLCQDLGDMTMTTKTMFTVGGVNYDEKKWVTVCKNGDIIEYRETPVKKFNDRVGDAGDYNEDYNNDFSIKNSFADYEIITQVFQDKLCNIAVKPCGCPESTIDNEILINTHCGNYLNPLLSCCTKRCNTFLTEINPKDVGEVSISDCETKIYIRKMSTNIEFLLLVYQTNGKCSFGNNIVPEKALMALWTGIDHRKKMFNNSFSWNDKEMARVAYEREKNNLITYDNKLSLEFLSNVSDALIRW